MSSDEIETVRAEKAKSGIRDRRAPFRGRKEGRHTQSRNGTAYSTAGQQRQTICDTQTVALQHNARTPQAKDKTNTANK